MVRFWTKKLIAAILFITASFINQSNVLAMDQALLPDNQDGVSIHQSNPPHVLFMILGGSHYNPTLPLVESLLKQGAHVTYLSDDPANKAWSQLKAMGADMHSYEELFEGFWQKNGNRQSFNHFYLNLVDQPEGVQDSAIQIQYVTARYWNEFLSITRSIAPDVIVYDAAAAGWGKYIAAKLNIPAFASWPPAFDPGWMDPKWLKESVRWYYRHKYPPTKKRLWATEQLHEKFGPKMSEKLDLDVNCPMALSLPEYGTIVYTYPGLEGYNGKNHINTSLYCVASAPAKQQINLSKEEQVVFDECKSKKEHGNKTLIFISMGTDSSKPVLFFELLAEALGDHGDADSENRNLLIVLHPGPKIARQEKHDVSQVVQILQAAGHSNFVVKEYFPLPKFFDLVDVFIGHGGKNSTIEAVLHKVPMIIMPIHGDQLIMASRVVEWGVGYAIPQELNVIAASDDQAKWDEIANNHELRAEFVEWLRDHVRQLLVERDTENFKAKQGALEQKFVGAMSYNEMATTILAAKTNASSSLITKDSSSLISGIVAAMNLLKKGYALCLRALTSFYRF